MADTFQEACKSAAHISMRDNCTIFVNAVVQLVKGLPTIHHFCTSDWYNCDSTLARFTNGEQKPI